MALLSETNQQYLISNYDTKSLALLSHELKLPPQYLYNIMYRIRRKKRKKCKIHRKRVFTPNLNPPTDTTRMLVCRYTYESMGIDEIAELLGRSEKWILEVIKTCKENGDYIRHNLFGRENL